MKTRLLLIMLLLLSLPVFLFGQSSGKVIGVVIDKASGDPLPGVNVYIPGSTFGAATDVDGYYVILNVPVGVYDIAANFVGYTEITLQGIRVSAGVTAEVNFDLEEATIEGDAVVVTAQRPLVEKHVTQSVSLVTSEDLANIPVRGFNDVLATQNSVVVQDEKIHIRGSRHDEVGYYIDGASSLDPTRNTQFIHVIQEAVEEFQVLAGGYNAEFGGANAGIIRTELKTGGTKYNFSIDYQTDRLANEGEKFLGTYSYGHQTTVGTLSGPLAGNKVRFFLAGENTYQRDRSVRFSEGFTLTDLVDANQDNPNVASGNPDSVSVYQYPAGFTPQRRENLWSGQGTLLFDFEPLQFRVSGSYSSREQQVNSFWESNNGSRPNAPMLNVLNDRTLDNTLDNLLLTGKLTYVLSANSLLDATVSFFDSHRDREDSYVGTNYLLWYDSLAVAQATNGAVQYASRYRPEEDYLFNGFVFARRGDPRNGYLREDQRYIGGTLNFLMQANRHHELKFGGDFRRYTLRRFAIEPDVLATLETAGSNDIHEVPVTTWMNAGRPDNYGYDVYGDKADGDQFKEGIQIAERPKNPIFGALYLQDKVEYKDLIINAGLRFDYFDSDGQVLLNPENPDVDRNTGNLTEEAWADKDPFLQVSPRLGFSFPVSEKTVFYMQYGKFIQMPELEANYAGISQYNREYVTGGRSFQDPSGYGLDPIRTTSYEIGFRQQLGSVAAFDLAGFYRNVKGQVQIDRITPAPESASKSAFNILVNSDFATTRGLELGITLRRINRLQGQLNYTLTSAEGTGSGRTTHVAAFEQTSPRPTVINPLDYEQAHRGSAILDYRFGRNDGGPIFQNFGINLLYTFNSGHPFTFAQSNVGQTDAYAAGVDYLADPRSRVALEEVNGSTTPFNWNFDLRLDKSFDITKGLQATVYARVLNLFNTKNVVNVFPTTGNAEDDGFIFNENVAQRNAFLEQWGEAWLQQYETINIKNGQSYWDLLSGGTPASPANLPEAELFGNPRQIFLGLKLSY